MLRLASYDIVFQEVPGEVTLALNLSCCPNGCKGCHSAHLQDEIGEVLDEELLGGLLTRYGRGISCVGFMGGDGDPAEVNRLAGLVKAGGAGSGFVSGSGFGSVSSSGSCDVAGAGSALRWPVGVGALKTAWYSGRESLAPEIELRNFDFVKSGPFMEELGGLDTEGTNQRFYRIEGGEMVDETEVFQKKPLL